jgi:leader peptidase (prepilin peptidase) / N-methyltransferase
MMERDWQRQCAELRAKRRNSKPLATSPSPLPLSELRPPDHCIGKHPPDQLPVILRGKCSGCATRISPRYPLVEALTGILSAYAVWHFGYTAAAAGALLLVWALVALTFIDFDTQLLPDSITLPLLWLGLAFNLAGTYTTIDAAVVGAMAGYLVLWSIFWLFKLATGKEGMGYGDFKLLGALGAWLGWQCCRRSFCFLQWSVQLSVSA